MTRTADTPFLPNTIRIKAEQYVWKHYPLSEWPLDKEISYAFTPIDETIGNNGEGKWFARVELPSLHAAYGLFIYVWDDGNVGGVLEEDGKQKMFTFVPPESTPVVTNWPTKPLDAEEEDIK